MKHSELPWKISKHASYMIESGNRSVGTVGGYTDGTEKSHLENQANAQFIVKACNNHYEYLELLFAALPYIADSDIDGHLDLYDKIRAIKEAE